MFNALVPFSLATIFSKTSNSSLTENNTLSTIDTFESQLVYKNSEPVENEENSIFMFKNGSHVLLNVPYTNQKEDLKDTPDGWAGGSACGPSAITMALNFNNEDISLYDVVNSLPSTVYVKGGMFYDLTSGPEYFGYTANEIDINTEQIFNTLSEGYPILLNIQNYDGITGHEVVVVGIKSYDADTKTAKSLIVHDPFKSPYREFKYVNETTLQQPEGWYLPIGIIDPFYITKSAFAADISTYTPASSVN